jgi:hypothetical protein
MGRRLNTVNVVKGAGELGAAGPSVVEPAVGRLDTSSWLGLGGAEEAFCAGKGPLPYSSECLPSDSPCATVACLARDSFGHSQLLDETIYDYDHLTCIKNFA